MILEKDAANGSPGQRLYPQGAAPCEEIQDHKPITTLTQDIEQRLPHPLGARPGSHTSGRIEATPSGLSSDYSHDAYPLESVVNPTTAAAKAEQGEQILDLRVESGLHAVELFAV